ncbi:hypothetical protein [Aureimonas mangrovi]|uniref:hypothetical protein n=1 Tax=Aureimonas mangrovi TaxID=2758041 RepID=UPI00163D634D|nr:hypothetical protein [Aureimonas mangrovi]
MMRGGLYLFVVFFIALGFQAGIATSAASAVKFGGWQKVCVTLSSEAEGSAGVLTPETPWPSCKSMVSVDGVDHDLSAPTAQRSLTRVRDADRGFWRILGIDEPPKPMLRTSSIFRTNA